jgi:hypothetical protein
VKLFRRRPVPDAVRAVRLEPGDRRVAWAVTVDAEPVVATGRGLVLPGRDLLAWADVERVVWRRPELRVLELAEVAGSGRATTVVLEGEDGGLPDVVQAGVTGSVAWTTHLRVQPQGGVRVVGRRRPGLELLDWLVVYDEGTDPRDPGIRAQAEQVVARARRTVG